MEALMEALSTNGLAAERVTVGLLSGSLSCLNPCRLAYVVDASSVHSSASGSAAPPFGGRAGWRRGRRAVRRGASLVSKGPEHITFPRS